MDCAEYNRLLSLPDAEFNALKTDELIEQMARHVMMCDTCTLSTSDETPQGALGDGSV